jgi:uncharacterized membrane protein YphA (DoxX/SURF4 family)
MATGTAVSASPSTRLHLALWTVQVLLAVAFGLAGFMKLTQPIGTLAASLVWPGDLPPLLVRFIGACEVLGAVGLILPSATRVKPGLTPLAAAGLLAVMLLAMPFHISRGEVALVPVNAVLGALALLVAWGRARKARLDAR